MGYKYTPELLEIWRRARDSEFGLRLEVSDYLIEQDLYETRQRAKDPSLDGLRVARMKNGELWIVKKEGKLED